MFKFLREVVETAVDFSAEIVKGTVEISTEIVADTAEFIGGENEVTKTIRSVGEGTSKATNYVVDNAAAPLAKAVGKGFVRKGERIKDVGVGLTKAAFTDDTKGGLTQAGKAMAEIVIIGATAGLAGAALEHFGDEIVSEPVGHVVDAVADFIGPDTHAEGVAELASNFEISDASGAGDAVHHMTGGSDVRFGDSDVVTMPVSANALDVSQTMDKIEAFALQHNDHAFAAKVQNINLDNPEQVKEIMAEAKDKFPRLRVRLPPRFGGDA